MLFLYEHRVKIYLFLFILFGLTVYSFSPIIRDKNQIMTKTISYKTEYVYRNNIPSTVKHTIIAGKNGILNTDNGKIIEQPINALVEQGTGPIGEYVGTLTGYGPDCVGCTGVVACHTKDRGNHNLFTDGITYNDASYSEVRILAADHELFPCGTILEISNSNFEKIIGIVLDTGATMRSAWRKNQKVFIDLAFETEEGTNVVTDKETKYIVKRWGW